MSWSALRQCLCLLDRKPFEVDYGGRHENSPPRRRARFPLLDPIASSSLGLLLRCWTLTSPRPTTLKTLLASALPLCPSTGWVAVMCTEASREGGKVCHHNYTTTNELPGTRLHACSKAIDTQSAKCRYMPVTLDCSLYSDCTVYRAI